VLVARGGVATAAAAIYAVSLAGVFGSSAMYHRGAWGPTARRRMRRLDHSMIFILIAGSYTPVSLLALRGPIAVVLLAAVWGGAAVGVTMKVARPDGFPATTGVLYLALGWAALVATPQLLRGLSAPAFVLLVVGGLLYTVGAIVFATKRPDPDPAVFGYHEIWHAFMAAASACHFALMVLVLRAS
jgi:hemolysin III